MRWKQAELPGGVHSVMLLPLALLLQRCSASHTCQNPGEEVGWCSQCCPEGCKARSGLCAVAPQASGWSNTQLLGSGTESRTSVLPKSSGQTDLGITGLFLPGNKAWPLLAPVSVNYGTLPSRLRVLSVFLPRAPSTCKPDLQ